MRHSRRRYELWSGEPTFGGQPLYACAAHVRKTRECLLYLPAFVLCHCFHDADVDGGPQPYSAAHESYQSIGTTDHDRFKFASCRVRPGVLVCFRCAHFRERHIRLVAGSLQNCYQITSYILALHPQGRLPASEPRVIGKTSPVSVHRL